MNCGAGVGILYSLPAEDRQTCRNRLKYRSFVVDCHKWRRTCAGINRNQGARRSVRREAVGKFRRSRTSKIHGYRSWCFRETRHSIRTILPRCLSYFPQGIHLPTCNIHARAPTGRVSAVRICWRLAPAVETWSRSGTGSPAEAPAGAAAFLRASHRFRADSAPVVPNEGYRISLPLRTHIPECSSI
jgi:hypothetical protein